MWPGCYRPCAGNPSSPHPTHHAPPTLAIAALPPCSVSRTSLLSARRVMLGRVLTSFLWGMISDRIGRPQCLQLSMCSVALGNLLFGVATNEWAALAVRFVLLGAANGYVSMIGPLSHDLGGSERQSEVLGFVFASGPVVQMAGPAVSSYLYGTLLPSFPAASPSLLGACLAVAAAAAVRAAWPAPRASAPVATATEMAAVPPPVGEAVESGDGCTASPVSVAHGTADKPQAHGTGGSGIPPPGLAVDSRPPRLTTVLCTSPVPVVIFVRTGAGCLLFGMFDVLPLWLAASRGVGGLAMDARTLGATLASSSLLMLPWVCSQGVFIRRAGVRSAIRAGVCISMFAYAAVAPLTLAAYAQQQPFLGLGVCVSLSALSNAAIGTVSTASFAATNNACARHPQHLGAISGVAVTFEAIGKMLGPAAGAPILGALLAAFDRNAALGRSGGSVVGGAGVDPLLNGATATMLLFAGCTLIILIAAIALPSVVDGPRRSALLHGTTSRSDAKSDRDPQ